MYLNSPTGAPHDNDHSPTNVNNPAGARSEARHPCKGGEQCVQGDPCEHCSRCASLASNFFTDGPLFRAQRAMPPDDAADQGAEEKEKKEGDIQLVEGNGT